MNEDFFHLDANEVKRKVLSNILAYFQTLIRSGCVLQLYHSVTMLSCFAVTDSDEDRCPHILLSHSTIATSKNII